MNFKSKKDPYLGSFLIANKLVIHFFFVNSFLFEENEENYSLLAIKNDPK